MKKFVIILLTLIVTLLFPFQIMLNGNQYNLKIDKEKFTIIELIPPFRKLNQIKIITDTKEYLGNKYDILENLDGVIRYNGEKVKEIKIDAEILNKKEWEIWVSWEGTDFIKEYLNQYSSRHHLFFKILEVPKISTKIVTMSKSGVNLPEVIMVSAFDFPTYLELNILKDNSFIPFYYDTQVVYINTNITNIDKLNWSLNDFEKISKNLLKNGIKPVAINPISAYWFSTFLMGYGKIPLIDNKFVLTDEATKKAIELIKNWYNNGLFNFKFLNRDAQIAEFLKGNVGFLFQGSFLMPLILEKSDNVKVLPLPYPMIPFKDYKGFATTKDGNTYFTAWLATFLKNPLFINEFSQKFVKFFDNYIPDNIPFKETFEYTSKIAQPIPFDKKYVKFHKNVMDILKLILNNSITIDNGLKKLEEIVNDE
ncbi:ABC transporter substrate-binding protein [Thermosipho atlanticus]|uniref:ABC-type glycerol-3-phosphate transport system, substrate-binding protein n=1 Tax=Thermosipho atlanticus DSM 15807 TaxID=1123380 RepID=A0A1M5RYX8_9BACT|nr:extracellular solute-binding protein [Thermosipho atlanticus]SHH31410.1 ABC-type glycerol-3-phosphate transport system, substrate-binding protein [Thermosipho atlanticus DSM 15807]